MDEYWVCHHCRSLNRAGSGRCYACGKKFGSTPKEASSARSGSPKPPGAPSGGTPPDFVAHGGSDSSETPAYFSRPIALPSPQTPYLTEATPQSRLPHPLRAIERRISAALAVRPSVSVTGLGYATAALLILLSAMAGLIILMGLPAATYALQHADVPGGWSQLTAGQQGLIKTLAMAGAFAGLLALISFSIFVGLSTHNTTGLGAEVTLLMPRSGALVWPSLVWVQARLAVALVLPTLLVYYGYELPAFVIAVLAVEVAQHHVDDGLDWLARPANHLPDLYRKFGTDGTRRSRLASIWSILFWIANLSAVVAWTVAPVSLTVATAMKVSSHDLKLWQDVGYGPGQIAILAVCGIFAIAAAASLIATILMVLGLIARQSTRRALARVGTSRSWITRPGDGAYGAAPSPGAAAAADAPVATAAPMSAASAPASLSGGYGDEDRFVERYPQGTMPPEYKPASYVARVAERRTGGPDAAFDVPAASAPASLAPASPPPAAPASAPPAPSAMRWGHPAGPPAQAEPPAAVPLPTPAVAPAPTPTPTATRHPEPPRMPERTAEQVPPRMSERVPEPPNAAQPPLAPPVRLPEPRLPEPTRAAEPTPPPESINPLTRLPEPPRTSELPPMPEGWAGPRPGGLLSRVSRQMTTAPRPGALQGNENGAPSSGAPSNPPSDRDQASLNSPSTTSSPASPDEPSDPPSD